MRNQLVSTLCVGLLGAVAVAQQGAGPIDYTFQHGFLEQDGITSMAELRGRPVFMEWWGAG